MFNIIIIFIKLIFEKEEGREDIKFYNPNTGPLKS